jgi:hypothetical protein
VEKEIHGYQTIYCARKERMISPINKIKETKTPYTFLYSDMDRLIEEHKFLELLGAGPSAATILSSDTNVIQQADQAIDWLRVFCVKGGGHFAFKSCTDLLENDIVKNVAGLQIK